MTAASLSKPGIRCGWRLPLLSSHLAKKTVGCHCVLGGRSSQIIYIYIYISFLSVTSCLFFVARRGIFNNDCTNLSPLYLPSIVGSPCVWPPAGFCFNHRAPIGCLPFFGHLTKGLAMSKIQGGESKVYKGHQWIQSTQANKSKQNVVRTVVN